MDSNSLPDRRGEGGGGGEGGGEGEQDEEEEEEEEEDEDKKNSVIKKKIENWHKKKYKQKNDDCIASL